MLKRPGERFQHPFSGSLVRLNKNLFMNRSDPRYYEKIIRYLDPSSPEAHYRIAQRSEAEGDAAKAVRHYRETMKRYPSDFYAPAARALRRLEAPAEAPGEDEPYGLQRNRLSLRPLVWLLVVLILLNLALLLLLLTAASAAQPATERKDFVIKQYVRAAETGSAYVPDGQEQIVLRAEANYVRTALFAYRRDHGALPPNIALLAADYPGNYVSFIPREPISGSERIVTAYDGSGGWVYDASASEAEAAFYPNVPVGGEPYDVPYEPLKIVIGKTEHALLLLMGSTVLLREKVGLGAEGKTPVGTLTVNDRVKEPAGLSPGIYGSAALGMGAIAIHGTVQPESIGADLSKGCIRVQNRGMAVLYELVPLGATVEIADRLPPAYSASGDGLLPALPAGRAGTNGQAPPGTLFHWLG